MFKILISFILSLNPQKNHARYNSNWYKDLQYYVSANIIPKMAKLRLFI